MLVRFAVKNFRSFNAHSEISMVANGRIRRMEDHAVDCGEVKLLRGAYVFGANASGKSNLVSAVAFAKKIIMDGSARGMRRFDQHCKFNINATDQPGVFQFEMLIDDQVYSYGFALSYRDGSIVEEWLYHLRSNGGETCIFARDEIGQVRSDLKLTGESRTRFKVYRDDIKALKRGLFLTELAKKPKHKDFHIFVQVYEWFRKVIVIYPHSKFEPLPLVIRDEKVRSQFEKYLNHFDTGIDSIDICSTTLEKELGSKGAEEFCAEFGQQLAEDIEFAVRGPRMLLALRRENNELKVEKLLLKHDNAYEPFDMVEESSGTKRLFDLIPLLFDSLDAQVIFIDEIDRSMHPRLTVEFVDLFYKYTKGKRLQMISTTHESALLDLNRIRQDEIWFVERQRDGSKLFSLDDFRVRYDKQIEKDYLLGRYGAVPLFASHYVSEAGEECDDPQA